VIIQVRNRGVEWFHHVLGKSTPLSWQVVRYVVRAFPTGLEASRSFLVRYSLGCDRSFHKRPDGDKARGKGGGILSLSVRDTEKRLETNSELNPHFVAQYKIRCTKNKGSKRR
jgi:hypothetical protein